MFNSFLHREGNKQLDKREQKMSENVYSLKRKVPPLLLLLQRFLNLTLISKKQQPIKQPASAGDTGEEVGVHVGSQPLLIILKERKKEDRLENLTYLHHTG